VGSSPTDGITAVRSAFPTRFQAVFGPRRRQEFQPETFQTENLISAAKNTSQCSSPVVAGSAALDRRVATKRAARGTEPTSACRRIGTV
jgi:hypothetical protein